MNEAMAMAQQSFGDTTILGSKDVHGLVGVFKQCQAFAVSADFNRHGNSLAVELVERLRARAHLYVAVTTGGATLVTITGSGFTGATAVTFGDTAAASFTVISDTSIQAVSPAHPAGTWDILITGPGGTSAPGSGDRYTFNAASAPSVTAVNPNSGGAAGGTSVVVTGTNFTGATGVLFGEVAATSFTVNADTSITATSPANPAGDVTVNTYGGFSATSVSDQFTYTVPAPTVTAVTLNSGSTTGGTRLTITGTHFTGASAVKFGTVAASGFTVVNDTTIAATSPSEAAGTQRTTAYPPHFEPTGPHLRVC